MDNRQQKESTDKDPAIPRWEGQYVRVGNFLCNHQSENSRLFCFSDSHGNSVKYGAPGYFHGIIVRICEAYRHGFEPLLRKYLEELVGRHDEKLHLFGVEQFKEVAITLPGPNEAHGLTVFIFCSGQNPYDYVEIACEIMAELSGAFNVCKAIAPDPRYFNFVRKDNMGDASQVRYVFEEYNMQVKFNFFNEHTCVVIEKGSSGPQADQEKFKETMYEFLAEYLVRISGQTMDRRLGIQEFTYLQSGREQHINVDIESEGALYFSVSGTHWDAITFQRVEFAKEAMRRLSQAFPIAALA